MPVPSKMADLFTIAASNSPSGSDLIGNSLDDYLRAGFAILRSTNALASASIAAASTTDLSTADAESVQITGSATINSLGTAVPGLIRECRFVSSCLLVNSASIVLPGAVNITTNAGDVITFRSLGSGIWAFVAGTNGAFLPLTGGILTGSLSVNYGVAGTALAITNTNAGGAIIKLTGDGATTPSKFIRSSGGSLQVVNNGNSTVILSLDDVGNAAFAGALSGSTISTTSNGTIGGNIVVTGTATATSYTASVGASGATFQVAPLGISGTMGIATGSNLPCVIGINGVESARFSQLGVMSLNGASNSNGAQIILNGNGATTPNKQIRARSGNLEIVNSANTAIISSLTDSGTWTATDFIATSDKGLKKKITAKQPNDRLADLLRLCTWLWKKTGVEGHGVIAQEVQKVAPEYVQKGSNGVLGVDKAGLALECVMGLAARVRVLEGK